MKLLVKGLLVAFGLWCLAGFAYEAWALLPPRRQQR